MPTATAVYSILFFAMFPALIIMTFVLDRIWPDNSERERRKAKGAHPTRERKAL